ncbi:hypothetical protein LWI29_014373 [Acer saccharum]|uniref:Uncharacterized protein n=1 Tax=Acer saccharum TaxID=4024 RepID=A0AA39SKZ0_ACESA|nr:hypothetical protein LWI29_014373 [Acer saccharum]
MENFFLKLAASELNSLEPNPRNGTQADPAYEKNTGNKKQLLIIVILTISLSVVTTLSFVTLCVRGKLRRKGKLIFLISMISAVNNNIHALINFIFLHHTGGFVAI